MGIARVRDRAYELRPGFRLFADKDPKTAENRTVEALYLYIFWR